MSEERFDRLEVRLDAVVADVAVLKTDMAVLKTDVAVLKTDVAGLKNDVGGLKNDVAGLTTGLVDLRRHMGVLHEDVIDRIAAANESDSIRREMRAGFAELRQMFQDHIVVGDAADRRFAVTVDDHERRITDLERR